MQNKATKRMLKAYGERVPSFSPLLRAAVKGESNIFLAARAAEQLKNVKNLNRG